VPAVDGRLADTRKAHASEELPVLVCRLVARTLADDLLAQGSFP
jgi:hypothetical protein